MGKTWLTLNAHLKSVGVKTSLISRRQMLRDSALAAAALTLCSPLAPLFAAPDQRRFKIGACDWSIGKLADPAALEVAKQIGLDGVQASLGTVANDMHLRQPEIQRRYQDAAKRTDVAVASLAIGELNLVPYKSDPRTVTWVSDSIDDYQALGGAPGAARVFQQRRSARRQSRRGRGREAAQSRRAQS